ncbi:SDR family NAD(P)-dependent oxidoreductase [Saccharothrix luteola]|uniref:SDR family NAD(P)-dependent oxidoreductase n=1 Tax=Saccharothrix luteola TaxID=2893018 RepID=UPI001E33612A|nr:SDR family NAD(P)-dependent oxidoreductase [Saccharothrix luteola]MCC8243051.1 SDR family NAD(P)-dependent oxidoreductase [Saccharothrix luteola]
MCLIVARPVLSAAWSWPRPAGPIGQASGAASTACSRRRRSGGSTTDRLADPDIQTYDNPDTAVGCRFDPATRPPCQNDTVQDAHTGPGPADCHPRCVNRFCAGGVFRVVGTSRDTSRIVSGDGVTFLDLDVTSDESVTSVVGQVIARFGRLDVLVNNAGVGTDVVAEEVSVAQAQRIFDVNVFGLMRMTRAVLPHMRTQGSGRIINVSSVGGVPIPFMAVQPGPINTPFDANLVRADTPLPVYAHRRRVFEDVMTEEMRGGDDPAVVARVIVAAATDPNRSCATWPARLPAVSPCCGASSPPGCSTRASVNSIG